MILVRMAISKSIPSYLCWSIPWLATSMIAILHQAVFALARSDWMTMGSGAVILEVLSSESLPYLISFVPRRNDLSTRVLKI